MWTRDPPQSEPLRLDEAKEHLRVDGDAEDLRITSLITAARERAEIVTRRSLADSVFTLHLDRARRRLELPRPPVTEVVSVEYDDPEGAVVLLEPAMYRAILFKEPGWIYFHAPLPARASHPGSLRVTYRAGYTEATLPRSIAQAMLLMIGHWYANREEVALGTIATPLPMAAASLLSGHKVSIYR